MIKYIGKVCPYCKSTFKEGDDIVVCSECEMPHHKDCWIDNKGCTTFDVRVQFKESILL